VWERTVLNQFDYFNGRILGLGNSFSAEIGDIVTVCLNRTALEFSDSQIEKWLENFGTVEGNFNYLKDKSGIKTDDLEVELKLTKHIPEYLPMYSRKIRVFYIGMPKQCNNCYESGHIKSECDNEKRDWFSFIEELSESGDFEKELFGDWPEVIERKRKQAKDNTREQAKGRGGNSQAKENKENENKKSWVPNRGRGRGRSARN
jgi:hypothetical protein